MIRLLFKQIQPSVLMARSFIYKILPRQSAPPPKKTEILPLKVFEPPPPETKVLPDDYVNPIIDFPLLKKKPPPKLHSAQRRYIPYSPMKINQIVWCVLFSF